MEHSTTHRQPGSFQESRPEIWSEPFPVRLGNAHFLLTPGELCVKEIRVGGELLIGAIYVAVRDARWGTGTIVLRQTTIQTRDSGEVVVRWQAQVALPNQDDGPMVYDWDISLVLGEHGLRFEANGSARQSFLRNRIGICVLLPDLLAGCACRSEPVNADAVDAQSIVLPVDIAPHQPLRNIGRLLVKSPHADLALDFTGDVFEMEDQRNWTDASFKIYGTPLDLPLPVSVNDGDVIEQCVSASWATRQTQPGNASQKISWPGFDQPIQVAWQDVTQPLVSIGIKLGSNTVPRETLDFQPHFVQIELNAEQWTNDRQVAVDSLEPMLRDVGRAWDGRVGIVLAVRQPLILTGDDWSCLKAFVELSASPCLLERVVAVIDDVPNDCLADIQREWISVSTEALANCMLCVATTRYFAEINRAQSHLAELPLRAVGYGINPQVHVFGDSEIFDTLPVQSQTALQAKRFGYEVHWWSVSLSPPSQPCEDRRLHTDLGAAWWLGSYIAALRAGVRSATWFSLGEGRGIRANSPLHRIMSQITRCVSDLTGPATAAIYTGPGVFGLRLGEAQWLVNCTGMHQLGWYQNGTALSESRQVWLDPWQILAWPAQP